MLILTPYPDMVESAKALRTDDLKQQVKDVLLALSVYHQTNDMADVPIEWLSHPVILMWHGHDMNLSNYGLALLDEWEERMKAGVSTVNGLVEFGAYRSRMQWHFECATSGEYIMEPPFWMGDVEVHDSHKAVLLLKDPVHYAKHWPGIDMELPLVWKAR